MESLLELGDVLILGAKVQRFQDQIPGGIKGI